jgi:hypothetical protein
LTGAPGRVRSSAYTQLGNGVTMYIVSSTTIGAASWPRFTPVENVNSTARFRTLETSISFSGL